MNVREIRPRVLHIEESYRVYCTLIRGETRAILFDTGLGEQDLSAFVRANAPGECLVLCSHGHYDHVGGIDAFASVYLNEADRPLLQGAHAGTRLLPLEPRTEFDLGGLHARAVPLAGHTRGSIGLLIPEERLLLAGDALSPRLQLLGPGAAPLNVLQETLQHTLDLPFDTFLAGHYPNGIPKRQISAHLAHLEAFRWSDTRPARFGGIDCLRSDRRGPEGHSTFLFDRSLEVKPDGDCGSSMGTAGGTADPSGL